MKSSKDQAPSSKEAPSPFPDVREEKAWESWDDVVADGSALMFQEASSELDRVFDFEERTARFGEKVIRFAKQVSRGPVNDRLISQVVGAATSIGANYCEANESVSSKDFRHNASRCLKEAKETRFFLRMIAASEPLLADQARILYREASELQRILSTMKSKSAGRTTS